ncbi:SDR family oxidoreductase [Rapidithrix thailandica]|uniref:SDR family oxidoreductase n=1 Tax=Rapidithrix thailandica TaxID=413964 RepID=A0AAW9S2J3_9BACT
MKLNNKNILLTGGSKGIGKATAKLLKEQGANVAITGRNREMLMEAAKELEVFPIHADVAQSEDIEKTYQLFLQEFGRLDVLINNAGIGASYSLEEVTREAFEEIYAVNVFGLALMTQKAAELFKKQSYGHIVNIASTAALKGYPGGTIYASSKFALRGMTQCWQAELRPYNVRVILVNPSEVTTAFGNPEREERPEEPNKLRPLEIAHTIVAALQMDERGFIPEVSVFATNPF